MAGATSGGAGGGGRGAGGGGQPAGGGAVGAAAPRDPAGAVTAELQGGVARGAFPGGAAAFGRGAGAPACVARAAGTFTFDVQSLPTGARSVFDAASLTKVLATTGALMVLHDQGLLRLDAPVAQAVPAFSGGDKDKVTARMLLSHTGGLREWFPFHRVPGLQGAEDVVARVCADPLKYPPGGEPHYSDLGFILLGRLVEVLSGQPLDAFCRERLFRPLGMAQTGFRRAEDVRWDPQVVPTEVDPERGLIWGEVHDPLAFVMGGVAGHAGLFTSALDAARFARCLLSGGACPDSGRAVFRPETVRLFAAPCARGRAKKPRALGWDLAARYSPSPGGQRMGGRTFGHLGFTGTSMWVDPDAGTYVVLLTNAVHPSAESKRANLILGVRPKVADAAMDALAAGGLAGRESWVPEEDGEAGSAAAGGAGPPASSSGRGGFASPPPAPGAGGPEGLRGGGAGVAAGARLALARAAGKAGRLLARGVRGIPPWLWRAWNRGGEDAAPRVTARLRPPSPPPG